MWRTRYSSFNFLKRRESFFRRLYLSILSYRFMSHCRITIAFCFLPTIFIIRIFDVFNCISISGSQFTILRCLVLIKSGSSRGCPHKLRFTYIIHTFHSIVISHTRNIPSMHSLFKVTLKILNLLL